MAHLGARVASGRGSDNITNGRKRRAMNGPSVNRHQPRVGGRVKVWGGGGGGFGARCGGRSCTLHVLISFPLLHLKVNDCFQCPAAPDVPPGPHRGHDQGPSSSSQNSSNQPQLPIQFLSTLTLVRAFGMSPDS